MKPRPIAAPEGRFALHVALDLFLLLTAFFASLTACALPQGSPARRLTNNLRGLNSRRRNISIISAGSWGLLAESIS